MTELKERQSLQGVRASLFVVMAGRVFKAGESSVLILVQIDPYSSGFTQVKVRTLSQQAQVKIDAASGGYSLVAAHRLLIAVPWLLLLQSTGSRHSGLVAAVLRLSRSTARGILVLRPGTEPALAGGFLTTGPPGKSQNFYECGLGGMT